MDACIKCGSKDDWGVWTSSSTGKRHRYCRRCRRTRAVKYTIRKKENGGSHTNAEWKKLLFSTTNCTICNEKWNEIPPRPDKRYKYVWTKDHIVPLTKGGQDNIGNIQAVCYRCNSSKCNIL